MDRRTEQYLNALDEALQKLENSLKAYTSEQLNRKPAPGEWSVMQVVNHVMMAESGSLNYLKKKLSDPSAIKKAGIGSAIRTWLLNLSQIIPGLKFKAPAFISEDKLPPVSDREAVFQQWRAGRAALRAFLEAQPNEIFAKEAFRHPRGGRMTIAQMLSFFASHLNRHRRQIRRILGRV